MSFASLAALGFASRLIPIIPPKAEISERSTLFKRIAAGDDARGKSPGVQWPDGRWSGFDWRAHQTIDADLTRWDAMHAGIGVKLDDGLVAIDADTLSEEIAGVIKGVVEKWLGKCPVRIGRYPKALYLVRTLAPYRYARIEFGLVNGHPRERVEVLSSGKQFVAEGIHPVTLAPYRWPWGMPSLSELPAVVPATLDGLMDELRRTLPDAGAVVREGVGPEGVEIDQVELRGKPEHVRAAIAALPNTTEHFPSRESYLGVGYRIKASLPDDLGLAFDLFSSWCGRWIDPDGHLNDPDIVDGDWRRMKGPFRKGSESLYRMAERLSGGAFNIAALRHHENVNESLVPVVDGLPCVTASDLAGKPIPPQEWLVKEMIPANNVTLLGGDGGTGKSLLALQLAVAKATGGEWLGHTLEPGGVVYLSAEDELDELHRRTSILCPDMTALTRLTFIPLAGEDAILAAPTGKGDILQETKLFASLDATLKRLRPALVILDTLADLFGGDEIKKTHARGFISMMRKRALAFELTAILLFHPSVSGMTKGTGTSGNVGWGNSVRSRLYLYRLKDKETDEELDIDQRNLEVKKSNRSATGLIIPLKYVRGRLVRQGVTSNQAEAVVDVDQAFLRLLDQFEREQRPVTWKTAQNYAPKLFADHPSSDRISKRQFAMAMDRLFEQGVIGRGVYTKSRHEYEKIVRRKATSEADLFG